MPNDVEIVEVMDEAEQARTEMHNLLDELDRAREEHAKGNATPEHVAATEEKTYEATERYLAALRKTPRKAPARKSA